MAVLLSERYKQPITIWKKSGTFTDSGNPGYSTPINETAHIDIHSKLVKNELGEELVSDHTVYTKTQCVPGDFIFLGTSVEAYPGDGARVVLKYEQFTSTRNPNKIVRVAYL